MFLQYEKGRIMGKLFKTNFTTPVIVLIPACIGINYLGKLFAAVLKLPLWLDCIGTCIGAILGLPVLPVAIGIYLPIHLNAGIMAGGLVRLAMEKRKYASEKAKNDCIQSGILYTSGMIAGEGVVGILLAVFAVLGWNLDLSGMINLGNIGGLVFFALLLLSIVFFCNKGRKTAKN